MFQMYVRMPRKCDGCQQMNALMEIGFVSSSKKPTLYYCFGCINANKHPRGDDVAYAGPVSGTRFPTRDDELVWGLVVLTGTTGDYELSTLM